MSDAYGLMVHKDREYQNSDDNTKNDQMNRKPFVEKIFNIIDQNAKLRICINGQWGCGKTWIAKILCEMNTEKKYEIINIDFKDIYFYSNPVFYITMEILEKYKSLENGKFESEIKETIKLISKKAVNIALSTLTSGGINSIDEIIGEGKNDFKFLDEYVNTKNDLKKIRDNIKSILEASDKKLLIQIDELDRIRPQLAIETIEQISNFFDINNLFIIYYLNIVNLTNYLNTLYGSKSDAYLFLDKYFEIKLNVENRLSSYFFNSVYPNQPLPINNSSIFEYLLQEYNIGLRDIDRILNAFKLFIYSNKEMYITFHNPLPGSIINYLIFLYYHDNDLFNCLKNGLSNDMGGKYSSQISNHILRDPKNAYISNTINGFLHSLKQEQVSDEIIQVQAMNIFTTKNHAGRVELISKTCKNIERSI